MTDDDELIERYLAPARVAAVRLVASFDDTSSWRATADAALAADYALETLLVLSSFVTICLRCIAARSSDTPDDFLLAVLDADWSAPPPRPQEI